MAEFIVYRPEIHLVPVAIEAENAEDAFIAVRDGEGEDVEAFATLYTDTLDPSDTQSWYVLPRDRETFHLTDGVCIDTETIAIEGEDFNEETY